MNDKEKQEIKEAIEEKISELTQRVKDLEEATKPMGLDNAVGRLSRMDYINNKTIDEANLRSSVSKLEALKRWLELIDTTKFGKCSKCGNEINPKRLLFMPESTRCIHCAGK
ncbi:MAG: TraR/DksA C4-type zinc finger protein [Cyclobacteriaceae bacterium]